MSLTWEELGARSAARHFPAVEGRDVDAVVATIGATGPVQSQTARSPYVGLAARLPGVERDTITAAQEQWRLVRGSNLRGTVHTSTAADHALMEAVTRWSMRAMCQRLWRPSAVEVDEVWAEVEAYAADEWRTAQEVHDHVRAWLDEHDPDHRASIDETVGRSMSNGHGGLLRKPSSGGWEGQGKPVYRTARELLGPRDSVLADPEGALDALVLRHVRWHGPSSRHDVAWWAGLTLGVVDGSLERLADRLVPLEGPDGLTFHDLPDAPPAAEEAGVRLLPEFDAVVCAYDTKRRDRFVTPEHFARLWNPRNALMQPFLLVDGRIRGTWRLEGSGARRRLDVRWFAGTRRPRKAEVERAAEALAAAYGVTLTGLALGSAG
ncbi:winged helix DNA-binding domain-containing protein [Nocardioides marmoraquaticus]